MKNDCIRLGTRGSTLALIQTQLVEKSLRKKYPELEFRQVVVQTRGDIVRDKPISQIGQNGVFTKELETSLLRGETDIAVHSLKDMPAATGEGLKIAGVLQRADPRDAFISKNGNTLSQIQKGAVIGTSSVRRRSIVKNQRPDCTVKELRGNVDTRLRKLDAGQYDAIILAAAGLIRSGYKDRIVEFLDIEIFLPSGCQGVIGMEVREDDEKNMVLVRGINHAETFHAVGGERSFMEALGGGCSTPMGCYARVEDGRIIITGMLADIDGSLMIKKTIQGPIEQTNMIASSLAGRILRAGGREIVYEMRENT